MKEQVDTELLQPIYDRLEQLLGAEAMVQIWSEFKGMQVNFPAHLYNRERVQRRIVTKHPSGNSQQLSRQYGYSQKWVEQMQREGRNQSS